MASTTPNTITTDNTSPPLDSSENPQEGFDTGAPESYSFGGRSYAQAGGSRHRRRRSKGKGNRRVPAVGSRRQVWNGTAHHTSGGLRKADLM
ncbi:MAG: hypothetical protein QF769_06620, partial [Candidatus Marinimicrobia bacterium]|nr:hypothetical protein [Candidatus Neomarinimicrobiota bacterium]